LNNGVGGQNGPGYGVSRVHGCRHLRTLLRKIWLVLVLLLPELFHPPRGLRVQRYIAVV
jgi:hypothetical protein